MSKVSTLTPAHAHAVTACYNAANERFPPGRRPNATVADFLEIFSRNTVLGWQDNGLAGFAAYRVENRLVFVEALYVDIAAGRKGIGTALMDAVKGAAQAQRAELCVADCLKNATWALNFYRKLGFTAYRAETCRLDNPHALAYFRAHETDTWSVRLYQPL